MNLLKRNTGLLFLLLLAAACRPEEEEGMVWVDNRFQMDISPVTVAGFREFVKATSYVTEAEKFGDGGVFDFATGQWQLIRGACWEYPFGPGAEKAPDDHPVTQVSWNDAQAYCRWAGKRLPRSEEFLLAEKNGRKDYPGTYTWGDDFLENGVFKANFWQGAFPVHNTGEDGFLTTSPVGHFGKNALGLTDMGGNVWQWCSDDSGVRPGEKNQRGGSFLCDPSVCHGFKIGGVASSSPETSLVHVGFRCVKDA
ncbi:MAG: formylglycine-generating enzyme family protein [Leadbetterella sp.]|nr:formylglycine-generating enzyme family protein [Leadbetterella sp.]